MEEILKTGVAESRYRPARRKSGRMAVKKTAGKDKNEICNDGSRVCGRNGTFG